MSRRSKQGNVRLSRSRRPVVKPGELRIIGGTLGGRRLIYSGDERTRPMKDRVREVVFNLLGPRIRGKFAIDLFAGTGAIGLEALSRGAVGSLFIEQHHPTARVIDDNIRTLGVQDQTRVINADTFIWARRPEGLSFSTPWAVFCSPPYDFFVDRTEAMLQIIEGFVRTAPPESLLVIEADARFDWQLLSEPDTWSQRQFPPAILGIRELEPGTEEAGSPEPDETQSSPEPR